MEHQSNKYNSTGTNRTIGTNGRVECSSTQPGAIWDIQSLHNEMHLPNGRPIK